MLIRRLFAAQLCLLSLFRGSAAEQSVLLFPGEGEDPRRAARVAYELKLRKDNLPIPAHNGWLTGVPLPETVDVVRIPSPADNGEYAVVSPHYLITSPRRLEDAALLRVAGVMEATYAANSAVATKLPVLRMLLRPKTRQKMHIRLVPTMDDYLRNGGVPGSSGVYQSSRLVYTDTGVSPEDQPCTEKTLKQDTILVAYPALGLREDGTLSHEPVNTPLLVHEGTHQCFIYNNLPIWANEGWAEYLSAAPHTDGLIDFEKGFHLISSRARRSASMGRLDCPFSLYDFFMMSKERMYAMGLSASSPVDAYGLAAMVVAFFLHMDGERGLGSMQAYLQERVECCPHAQALEKLAAPYGGVQALQIELVRAWQARGIDLKLQSSLQK